MHFRPIVACSFSCMERSIYFYIWRHSPRPNIHWSLLSYYLDKCFVILKVGLRRLKGRHCFPLVTYQQKAANIPISEVSLKGCLVSAKGNSPMSSTILPKPAQPAGAKQLSLLPCLMVYVKSKALCDITVSRKIKGGDSTLSEECKNVTGDFFCNRGSRQT